MAITVRDLQARFGQLATADQNLSRADADEILGLIKSAPADDQPALKAELERLVSAFDYEQVDARLKIYLVSPDANPVPAVRVDPVHDQKPGVISFEGPFADYRFSDTVLSGNFPGYNGIKQADMGSVSIRYPWSPTPTVVKDLHYRRPDGQLGMHFIPVQDPQQVTETEASYLRVKERTPATMTLPNEMHIQAGAALPDGTKAETDTVLPAGTKVPGSYLMDNYIGSYIRNQIGGVNKNMPHAAQLYTLISYQHPEEHTLDFGGIFQGTGSQGRFTHMGAYYGNGITLNSPKDYHDMAWGVHAYPTTIALAEIVGEPIDQTMKNAMLTGTVLNKDVVFSSQDYTNDQYVAAQVNISMMLFRDWIKGGNHAKYIKEETRFQQYCAEHQTFNAIVSLNLPINLESFKEMFGREGAHLWEEYKKRFEESNGRPFNEATDTAHFEPLWKKQALHDAAAAGTPVETEDQKKKVIADALKRVQPMKSKAAFLKWEEQRRQDAKAGKYDALDGIGMPWMPETTADLVNDIVESYASFGDSGGGLAAASALVALRGQAMFRNQMSAEQVDALIKPFLEKIMLHEYFVTGTAGADEKAGWIVKHSQILTGMFTQILASAQPPDEWFDGARTDQDFADRMAKWTEDQTKVAKTLVDDALRLVITTRPMTQPLTRSAAHENLKKSIQKDLGKARAQVVQSKQGIEWTSSPAIAHRVAMGMHEGNPMLKLHEIGTAIDVAELVSPSGEPAVPTEPHGPVEPAVDPILNPVVIEPVDPIDGGTNFTPGG